MPTRSSTPLPGKPVRGSQTGRPLMALFDLLGRRWVLRILWELRAESIGFRELQRRCESVSPSVLSQRLRDLLEAGLLQVREDAAYELSSDGVALLEAIAPLNAWAAKWGKRHGN